MERIPDIKSSEERFNELKKKLEDFYEILSDKDRDDLTMERMARGAYLLSKYPNARNYAFYHVLIGSTISNPASIEYEDFPQEDSIKSYIDSLANPK
ncbi:MAG: hypothetical protein ACYCY6_00175 [Minisyncoccota bacterium]